MNQAAIDWGKMPADTLVRYNRKKYYFAYVDHKNQARLYIDSKDSSISEGKTFKVDQQRIVLLEGKVQPWLGGDCPVDDNIVVRVWRRNYDCNYTLHSDRKAGCLVWRWDQGSSADILAYKIVGL